MTVVLLYITFFCLTRIFCSDMIFIEIGGLLVGLRDGRNVPKMGDDDILVDFGDLSQLNRQEKVEADTFRKRREFDIELRKGVSEVIAKAEVDEILKDDDPIEASVNICKESSKVAKLLAETKIRDARKLLFIKGYLAKGSVRGALMMSGVTSTEYKTWMLGKTQENAMFRHVVSECVDMMADVLEEEAFRLALSGNDRVLLKMLEGYRPERYAQKKTMTHEGSVNLNITNWADLARKAEAVIEADGGTVDDGGEEII